MSITALCELWPLPEQAGAIIQLAIEQLSLPSASVVGRRSARLYQHVDDPAWLLYIGAWESREAFEAYRAARPLPGAPDQYRRPPTCRVYRRLALFERVLSPVGLVHAITVDGPVSSHAARRDLALAYHRASLRGPDNPVLLMIDEAVDAPAGLLIVSGWASSQPFAEQAPAPDQALLDQLLAAGARVERFVGRALVETVGS